MSDESAVPDPSVEPPLPPELQPDCDQHDFGFRQACAKVREFPQTPGVYLMKDAAGRVIYVGKAKNLRARAGSYFLKAAFDERRTDARGAARDESMPHGTRTTLPVERRSATRRSAASASASGYVAPTTGATSPDAQRSSTSAAASRASSGRSFSSRPR